MTDQLLNDAIVFAVAQHAGATRKGTDIPYIVHPMEAAAIAAALTGDREVIAAAVLHDVVEDTDATREDVARRFGERVARLVASDSEDKMPHLPADISWKLRKQATLAQLDHADEDEQIVVLADKLSNLRSLYRDYRTLGDGLWQRFNQKDKAQHAWYYRTIAEKLTALRGTAPFEEYTELLDRVFPVER